MLQVDFHNIWIASGFHYSLHSAAQHRLSSLFFDEYFHNSIQDFISDLGIHLPLLCVVSVGVDEDCSCQRKSGKFPSAQSRATFLAGLAVTVPVRLLGNL